MFKVSAFANPFFGKDAPKKMSKTKERWNHLWSHTSIGEVAYTTLKNHSINWKAFCKPAILPLTMHYCPSLADLKRNYFEYNWFISVAPSDIGLAIPPASVLTELICQRQAQDYQYIESAEVQRDKDGKQATYLGVVNQLHKITYDQQQQVRTIRTQPAHLLLHLHLFIHVDVHVDIDVNVHLRVDIHLQRNLHLHPILEHTPPPSPILPPTPPPLPPSPPPLPPTSTPLPPPTSTRRRKQSLHNIY